MDTSLHSRTVRREREVGNSRDQLSLSSSMFPHLLSCSGKSALLHTSVEDCPTHSFASAEAVTRGPRKKKKQQPSAC